jgi:hypothetical protein
MNGTVLIAKISHFTFQYDFSKVTEKRKCLQVEYIRLKIQKICAIFAIFLYVLPYLQPVSHLNQVFTNFQQAFLLLNVFLLASLTLLFVLLLSTLLLPMFLLLLVSLALMFLLLLASLVLLASLLLLDNVGDPAFADVPAIADVSAFADVPSIAGVSAFAASLLLLETLLSLASSPLLSVVFGVAVVVFSDARKLQLLWLGGGGGGFARSPYSC